MTTSRKCLKATLVLEGNNIYASFRDCATDNLTEGFNGAYHKFTNAAAADYVVSFPRSYFHKKPNINSKTEILLS